MQTQKQTQALCFRVDFIQTGRKISEWPCKLSPEAGVRWDEHQGRTPACQKAGHRSQGSGPGAAAGLVAPAWG